MSAIISTETTPVLPYETRPPSCCDTFWFIDINPGEERKYWTEEEVNHWHIDSNEHRVWSKYHKWGFITMMAGGALAGGSRTIDITIPGGFEAQIGVFATGVTLTAIGTIFTLSMQYLFHHGVR